MNANIVTSVTTSFITREKERLFTDTASYTDRMLRRIKKRPVDRAFGNCVLVLQIGHGDAALLGLATTFTLLENWQKSQSDNSWLESQLDAIKCLGNEKVRGYAIPFLDNPGIGISQVMELLGKNLPVNDFISFCEKRCVSFNIGAYLLIGLLLLVDQNRSGEEALALQT